MLRKLMEKFVDEPVEGAMAMFLASTGLAALGFIVICILSFAKWALFGGCPTNG